MVKCIQLLGVTRCKHVLHAFIPSSTNLALFRCSQIYTAPAAIATAAAAAATACKMQVPDAAQLHLKSAQ